MRRGYRTLPGSLEDQLAAGTGRCLRPRRAQEFGLVDHLVSAESFQQEVDALVQRYLALSSAGALHSKVLLSECKDLPFGEFFEEYLRRQALAVASPDHDEAMQAYREGRAPVYPATPPGH